MQKISCIERKSNQDILEIIGEKRLLVDSMRERRLKMIRHTLRHPEELHNAIMESMIKGKRQ